MQFAFPFWFPSISQKRDSLVAQLDLVVYGSGLDEASHCWLKFECLPLTHGMTLAHTHTHARTHARTLVGALIADVTCTFSSVL